MTIKSTWAGRLDMDLPILDILSSAASPAPPNAYHCDRRQWASDVEFYAPGYLALEAVGKGGEYDLSCLTAPDEIPAGRKPVYERMMAELMLGKPQLIAYALH